VASTPRGQITITDVARHAGVSLATVSRVMNGNTRVDPALAERVHTSARRLGYRASPLARSLVLGRTQTVAILLPDLANPTFQAILSGFSRAAKADGYHVLIADSAENVEEEQALALELRQRTDGVVLCAPRMPGDELATLLPQTLPAVLINREPYFGTDTIAADYGAAMRDLVEHLYGLGHRHLVFLSGTARSVSNALRLAAVDAARTSHPDLRIDEVAAGVDFDSGAAAVDAVIDSGATGVLAYNDLVAMGLLSALGERGLRVPEDISVTGFDDIPFARYTTPPLTTAAVPGAQIGAHAWEALRSRLGDGATRTESVLPATVQVRASTGPAPR
jgi:LacI family transcriptional regulator